MKEANMNSLIFPMARFQRAMLALRRQPEAIVRAGIGLDPSGGEPKWLSRHFDLVTSGSGAGPTEVGSFLLVSLTGTRPPVLEQLTLPKNLRGHLWIGVEEQRNHAWGVIRPHPGGDVEPIEKLVLVGPGMHEIQLDSLANPPKYPDTESLYRMLAPPPLVEPQEISRWSRTMGAFGDPAAWKRLRKLNYAIVGCGRTGSLVALGLARLGVLNLHIVDPDHVEPHNLGEMELAYDDEVGKFKAASVCRHLKAQFGHWNKLEAITTEVTDQRALSALKASDVLFLAPDNDAARLATAIIATMFHKVLFDLGTGIQFPEAPAANGRTGATSRPRTMGLDVRLILPGDGCLLCRGGLANYTAAVEQLCASRPKADRQNQDWQAARAGSLRSLNQIAAGVALRMLEDLITERIQHTTWARVEFDDTGRMSVRYPEFPAKTRPCSLCLKAGLGEDGLRWG
jgi:hypothetical protein